MNAVTLFPRFLIICSVILIIAGVAQVLVRPRGDKETLLHLLKYDSVHRTFHHIAETKALGCTIKFRAEKKASIARYRGLVRIRSGR